MILNLWRHKAMVHGEGYDEDFLLYILTEQNYELQEKIKKLEEATKENSVEVQKVRVALVHEDVAMVDIVDNQADLIIDSLKVNRKIDDLMKTNNPNAADEPSILWVGTSLSNEHLNNSILQENTNTKVNKLKAFTISGGDGRRNKSLNIEDLVPKALADKKYDLIVIESGVNEISNMDIRKEGHVLREEVRNKMEKLFLLAVKYSTDFPDLKVVLLNRLPRLDSTLRADLGREADKAMAKLWEGCGSPDNIILESLNLQVDSPREKEEVFGRQGGKGAHGIHLRGPAGAKEFTYRAGRLLRKVLGSERKEEKERRSGAGRGEERKEEEKKRKEIEQKRRNRREEEIQHQVTKERQRRMTEIRMREEESRMRIQENRRQEQIRKQNKEKREERIRVSDMRQQEKYAKKRRSTRYSNQETGAGEEPSWARVTAAGGSNGRERGTRRSNSDYEERKRAREARHWEADEREGRPDCRERRLRRGYTNEGRKHWVPREMRRDRSPPREERRELRTFREDRRAASHRREERREPRTFREDRRAAGPRREVRREPRTFSEDRRGRRLHREVGKGLGTFREDRRRSSVHREERRDLRSFREDRRAASPRREERRELRTAREDRRGSGMRREERKDPRTSREDRRAASPRREERREDYYYHGKRGDREEKEQGFFSMHQFPLLRGAGNGRRGAVAPHPRAY